VPPLMAKTLLGKLSDRHFTVEDGQTIYNDVEIVEDSLPIHFSLTQNDREELLLHMHNIAGGTYFKDYDCLFLDGTFYFPTKEQSSVLGFVSTMGMEDHKLPVKQSQSNMFLSE